MRKTENPIELDKTVVRAAAAGMRGSAKWLALAAAVLGWMFDGLEMGLFPLVGRPALTEMLGGANIGPWFGAIIAVFLVGAALGGIALGWLGDRIGRTRAMVWSVLAYSVFSGLGAVATAPPSGREAPGT